MFAASDPQRGLGSQNSRIRTSATLAMASATDIISALCVRSLLPCRAAMVGDSEPASDDDDTDASSGTSGASPWCCKARREDVQQHWRGEAPTAFQPRLCDHERHWPQSLDAALLTTSREVAARCASECCPCAPLRAGRSCAPATPRCGAWRPCGRRRRRRAAPGRPPSPPARPPRPPEPRPSRRTAALPGAGLPPSLPSPLHPAASMFIRHVTLRRAAVATFGSKATVSGTVVLHTGITRCPTIERLSNKAHSLPHASHG